MKVSGKKLSTGPSSSMIVFPRAEGNIALRFTAQLDREEFDRLFPEPKPPKKMVKGGNKVDDLDNPTYVKQLESRSKAYLHWLIIASITYIDPKLGDVPLEWETVDRSQYQTWSLWESELKESGFSDMERKRIYAEVTSVNSLNDATLDEARNSFLRLQQEGHEQSSSPTDGQNDTPSGEPANDSESDPQASPQPGTTSTTP